MEDSNEEEDFEKYTTDTIEFYNTVIKSDGLKHVEV